MKIAKNLNKYFIVSDRHYYLPKMQTFTKKFITFKQIEIFEFSKQHCKVQEAYFTKQITNSMGTKEMLKFKMSIRAFSKK